MSRQIFRRMAKSGSTLERAFDRPTTAIVRTETVPDNDEFIAVECARRLDQPRRELIEPLVHLGPAAIHEITRENPVQPALAGYASGCQATGSTAQRRHSASTTAITAARMLLFVSSRATTMPTARPMIVFAITLKNGAAEKSRVTPRKRHVLPRRAGPDEIRKCHHTLDGLQGQRSWKLRAHDVLPVQEFECRLRLPVWTGCI